MDENKDTIKWWVKKLSIRNTLFIFYHFGLIGSMFGLFAFVYLPHLWWRSYTLELDSEPLNRLGVHLIGCMVASAIGIHFFGNLLYKEYSREDK